MTFTVKQQPKKIYESVTHEFTVTDEEGTEYQLRKWEDTNGGGYYILRNGDWEEYHPDEELDDFILYDLDF